MGYASLPPLERTARAAWALTLLLSGMPALAEADPGAAKAQAGRTRTEITRPDQPGIDSKRHSDRLRSTPSGLFRAPFTYRADGKALADVLRDFAASQSLPLVIADGIDGMVKGDFDMQPQRFLDILAKAYGLTWYHDGIALYIYPSSAVQSRMIRLLGFRESTVMSLLDSLQLGDKRFPLRFDPQAQTLLVYGPPRHIELVSEAIEQLEAGSAERNQRVVRVVPLRFASAGDRNFGETKVPGLVSTLNSIYAQTNEAGEGQGQRDAGGLHRADRVKPQPNMSGTQGGKNIADLFGVRTADKGKIAPADALAHADNPTTARSTARQLDQLAPIFRAEEASNSILVYAQPHQLASCIELINRLDVRPTLIEIEATIIDVSSDSVDQLGITWSASAGASSVSVTSPSAGGNAIPFTIGTVLSNAGRELLARVNALQAGGKASVLGKPKVLGLANRTAVMVNKRTVTVKVAGNLEANLFQIDAGTRLQVTPQIDAQDLNGQIRLALYIEDGSFEDMLVDGVPVLKRIEISTEALVDTGQSILIGGITTNSELKQLSAVPGLGGLPFVGALFRTRREAVQRNERMFLITPRLIRDSLPVQSPLMSGKDGEPVPVLRSPRTPAVAYPNGLDSLQDSSLDAGRKPAARRARRAEKAS